MLIENMQVQEIYNESLLQILGYYCVRRGMLQVHFQGHRTFLSVIIFALDTKYRTYL